jgi:hypothetical protein
MIANNQTIILNEGKKQGGECPAKLISFFGDSASGRIEERKTSVADIILAYVI